MEIRTDLIEQAARALSAFTAASSTSAQPETSVLSLFEAPAQTKRPIIVEISFLKAPTPNRVPMYFKLPHEIVESRNICLITPAPQRKYKDQLADEGIETSVAKVIDVVKLQAKFSNPVARRALAKSFEAFFVHSDVSEFPDILTGEFLTWQTPVWMDPASKSLDTKIKATRCMAVVPRRGFDNVSVVVGNSGQSVDEIVSNTESLCKQLGEACEGANCILSIRLAASNTRGQRVALPFFAHRFAADADDSTIGNKRPRD